MKTSADNKCRLPIFMERLNLLRGEMTYEKFAKKLGISKPTMGFYLSGQRIPDALTLRDIANKCDVSADYLLGLSDAADVKNKDIGKKLGLNDESIHVLHELTRKPLSKIGVNAILKKPDIMQYLIRYLLAFLEDERQTSRFKDVPLQHSLLIGYADMNLVKLIERLPRWKDETVEELKSDEIHFEEMLLAYVAAYADKSRCHYAVYGLDDDEKPDLDTGLFAEPDEYKLSEEDRAFWDTQSNAIEEVLHYIDEQEKEF